MESRHTAEDTARYVARQLDTFFPDGKSVRPAQLRPFVDRALDRVELCFRRIRWPSYGGENEARFDLLNSDHYCAFLYLLSNTVHREEGDPAAATKLFYLNKTLHAFNCMFDTALPDIFWIVHAVGTVLGKAAYSNFFVVHQGCTVGALSGEYPTIGERVLLSAGVAVIGKSRVGTNVTLAPGCSIVKRDIPDDSLVTGEGTVRSLTGRGAAALFYPA